MKKHQLVTNATRLARLGKFADKLIGKLVKAGNSDSRDWDKIRGWDSVMADSWN